MLATVPGEVWLTETGGIVRFSPGSGGLPYDERRAADGIRYLYSLLGDRPRIARMYLYQWQSAATEMFDAGLVGYDGAARPGLRALAAALGVGALPADDGRSVTSTTSTVDSERRGTGTTPSVAELMSAGVASVRASGRGVRLIRSGRRGVRVRLTCLSESDVCAGVASLRLGVRRLVGRLKYRVSAAATRSFDVPVGPAAFVRLARARRVLLRTCPADGRACAAQTVRLLGAG
jgi:hypothetical protein